MLTRALLVPFLQRLWYDVVLDCGLNPVPPALEASTKPLGYIKQGITFVKNHYDTIIWLKFDKLFFNVENDVYVCAVYMWSDDSPAARVYEGDMFNVLDIYLFENVGYVCVAGDTNDEGLITYYMI